MCNLACAHCLRGSAQNKSITPEIIDKLIRNIDFVEMVYITGGEPLLDIDLFSYLIKRLSTKQVQKIGLTTNGTVMDKRVIEILEEFCLGNELKDRQVIIAVSDDKFHSGEHDTAFDFYTKLAGAPINGYEQLAERLTMHYPLS